MVSALKLIANSFKNRSVLILLAVVALAFGLTLFTNIYLKITKKEPSKQEEEITPIAQADYPQINTSNPVFTTGTLTKIEENTLTLKYATGTEGSVELDSKIAIFLPDKSGTYDDLNLLKVGQQVEVTLIPKDNKPVGVYIRVLK